MDSITAVHQMIAKTCTIYLEVTSLVAWWSELLNTNQEVRGSILGSAVGIFPCREDPHSNHSLGSLQNVGLRPLLVLHAHTYRHSRHRGNVTASCGRPNLRNRSHFGHNQEGGDHEVYMDMGVTMKKQFGGFLENRF
jgi:hypothetical protein